MQLQELDISFNLISEECSNGLKLLISENRSLKIVNLKSNLLRDLAGKSILEALTTNNKTLLKIKLELN